MTGCGGTVLLVDDDEQVLDLSRRILERLGYTVLSTTEPSFALRMAQTYAFRIDLLVTDVVMPGMNGFELVERMLELLPGIRYLFISGYACGAMDHRGLLRDDANFIQKPFTIKELARKLSCSMPA